MLEAVKLRILFIIFDLKMIHIRRPFTHTLFTHTHTHTHTLPDGDDPNIQRDPKWTQSIISLFSSNAMEVLIDLLKKLSEVVLPSWCQRQPLTVTHAGSIVNLATFALQLLKAMLTSLLSDGDYQLRDTRVVSALLAVHTVLCSAPYSSVISSAAPEVKV